MHKFHCTMPGRWTARITTGLLLTVSLIGLSTASVRTAQAQNRTGIPRGNVVAVRINVARARIEDVNATFGTTVLDSIPDIPGVFLLQVPQGCDVPQLLFRLLNDPRLLYAELDAVGRTPVTAHPRSISAWGGFDPASYNEQTSAYNLKLDDAHKLATGAGTVVAIVDTGVQLDHPFLASSYSATGIDFIDNDTDSNDVASGLDEDSNGVFDQAYGHGTHVAGIVHLVAPAAKLLPIRVIDSDGFGYVFTVAKAISWAAHHSANVINLSLGTGQDSRVLRDAVNDARSQGAIVVGAAGNMNWMSKEYPSADINALGVTSISDQGIKSSFANYGQWVDLSAPGENIVSTYPGSTFAVWSGTSMATPFVAGEAALIKSLQPAWSASTVMAFMQQCVISLKDSDRQYKELIGAGRIDPVTCLAQAREGMFKISPSK